MDAHVETIRRRFTRSLPRSTWSRITSARPEARPWWSWAGLGAVALLASVLLLWGLSRNGLANSYYAAAVKSGSISWKAWFFGSLDPGSFITVDKLPGALWLEGLSARVFGFSSWSMLVPQALCGVGSVLIVHHLVRRWQGDVAALLAALALALTPVAVLMFRFNNPDALLTFLLLAAAWALWSALETGSSWKLAACGVLVGFAFLTKMLEALVVLPAFVVVYLVCGPRRLVRRVVQLLGAGVALLVAGGWYVAVVALWPAGSRPYIGGSGNNSVVGLVFSRSAGYLSGSSGGPGFGGQGFGGQGFGGTPGWLRMFNDQLGGQAAWLVPFALIGLVAGLWITSRGRRTDLGRAGYLMWGMWAVLLLGVFSFAKGVLHPYYTVMLAPAIAALAGGGSAAMWRLGRRHLSLVWILPLAVLVTAFLSYVLLQRTASFAPGLDVAVLVAGGTGAVLIALVLADVLSPRKVGVLAGVVGLVCVLAGPAAYSFATVSRSVTGALAAAGPSVSGFGGRGGGFGGLGGGPGAVAQDSPSTVAETALMKYLVASKGAARYLVAVYGAQAAEPLILATGEPVMAMGGFNGSDDAPTLIEFQQMVAQKKVRYVLIGGAGQGGPGGMPGPGGFGGFPGGGPGGLRRASAAVSQWVEANAQIVDEGVYGGGSGGGTLYRLW